MPIDKELPANEIANIIINSDSEVVIYSKKYEEKVRSVSGMLQNVKYFIALDDEENSADGKTFSYKELMIKPNKKIYELICNRYDINPAEAVFLDDTEKNIAAAREYGLHGIHFHSYEQGRAELEELLKS